MNGSLDFPPMVAPTWDADAHDRVAACRREVEAAVAHPAWDALARQFGERLPGGHEARLDRLVHLADHCWDFRRGAERNLVRAAEPPPPTTIAVVEAAAASFGMTSDTVPSRDRYDAVLVMGGLVRGCFARPAYAARLFAAGLRAPEVAALTGKRPLLEDERALADALGFPEIDSEAAALTCGLLSAFGGGRPVAAPRVSDLGSVDAFVRPAGPVLEVFKAAPGEGRDRANTRDTFDHWAAGVLRPRSRVLVVTTSIYVPYQACVAVEALGIRNGISVETVGTAMTGPEPWAQRFEWFHYLQEFGSAARALRALEFALRDLDA